MPWVWQEQKTVWFHLSPLEKRMNPVIATIVQMAIFERYELCLGSCQTRIGTTTANESLQVVQFDTETVEQKMPQKSWIASEVRQSPPMLNYVINWLITNYLLLLFTPPVTVKLNVVLHVLNRVSNPVDVFRIYHSTTSWWKKDNTTVVNLLRVNLPKHVHFTCDVVHCSY